MGKALLGRKFTSALEAHELATAWPSSKVGQARALGAHWRARCPGSGIGQDVRKDSLPPYPMAGRDTRKSRPSIALGLHLQAGNEGIACGLFFEPDRAQGTRKLA